MQIVPPFRNSYRVEYARQPHTCPVCKGYGHIVLPLGTTSTTQTCTACKGACVLWEPTLEAAAP